MKLILAIAGAVGMLAAVPSAYANMECPVDNLIANSAEPIYLPVGEGYSLGEEPEPATIAGRIPGSRVNVRTGPGEEYDAPAHGLVGDRVAALEFAFSSKCETWFKVRFPESDHIGWVHSVHVDLR
ncbi:SH3 domain-containing protein [Romeria aff. gracilis LEGE 07310]|uniref:SH3 domain-containing protein n=1 Tax=Vasconcelosia minhoensis LEGE 07310 TaxID=915328 RepID=A0A8J7DCT4_9CYAN|nr:SH3 domain-containing protein [Romeria gracilis]MBE9079222.1 SH3 domain-containing protein [Romeria aff. gracilis LEGE 07310]